MNWLQKLMYGRYGGDHLSIFLLWLSPLLSLIAMIPHLGFVRWVVFLPALLALLRMLSRNFNRRRAENAKFLKIIAPILARWRLWRTRRRDKDHSYFKCPSCGQQLRVPKGKGKISVTCRSCGVSFEAKS